MGFLLTHYLILLLCQMDKKSNNKSLVVIYRGVCVCVCLKISFRSYLHSMPHHVPRMMMMMFCSCSCREFVWYFFFVVDLLSSCYFNSAIPESPVMLLLCDLHNTCIIIQFSSSVWFSTATSELLLLLHHILFFFSFFCFFKGKIILESIIS